MNLRAGELVPSSLLIYVGTTSRGTKTGPTSPSIPHPSRWRVLRPACSVPASQQVKFQPVWAQKKPFGSPGSSPHHVDGLGVAGEAEGVAAGRGAEVDGDHHGEGRAGLGPSLAPLEPRAALGSAGWGAGSERGCCRDTGNRARERVHFSRVGPAGAAVSAGARDAVMLRFLQQDTQLQINPNYSVIL